MTKNEETENGEKPMSALDDLLECLDDLGYSSDFVDTLATDLERSHDGQSETLQSLVGELVSLVSVSVTGSEARIPGGTAFLPALHVFLGQIGARPHRPTHLPELVC